MKRLIIVSNRLPVKIEKNDEKLEVIPSAGGLATGLKSYHKSNNSLWIGWPGLNAESRKEENQITTLLQKEACLPVFLNENLIENYYDGFSNTILWPLFHYFIEYCKFKEDFWQAYKKVNEIFAEAIIANANENDTVWVHDYQLMLVPEILKRKRPDLSIGFFLHIPFPSYEIIRILPWREEILNGVLGADLIGFHTYDYARHFISSVKRLLGHDVDFNKINLENRQIYIDVFPMGIDYKKFEDKALEIQTKPIQERSKEHQDIDRFLLSVPNRKLILSIDRLDYTKGIPARLKAFRHFLRNHPEYKERVSLIMLTVPSRVDVKQYQDLRSEVEKLVGSINGYYGTINWNPIIYFYRSMPFDNLIELYSSADIALLTPLRDGMNLVAKEFIASKINHKGVLILSEMAGASKELGEAIAVNPNNIGDVSNAIYKALIMSDEDQKKSITAMQDRITRYDVYKWASDFVEALHKTEEKQAEYQARKVSVSLKTKLKDAYENANQRVLFLDYDGTLQRFFDTPKAAVPDAELIRLLNILANDTNNELVLISGRDQQTLNEWFGDKNYTIIAEHGAWIKEKHANWRERNPKKSNWKENIRPILESYVDRTPGSLIEEKTHSLVWHYRKADIELGVLRALELRANVSNLISNQDLEILEGNKVIEIKVSGINKGSAAIEYLTDKTFDFLMAIGDDWTDEFLFKELPKNALTIKVGTDKSAAKYYVDSYKDVRTLLKSFIENN
ncbi:bifunctional alpha,alpha-trehalose-phosphate synthase (UDP-forming)/trehalose-phosphatase [Lutibacter sp. B1]|uniref:bifunctional alpha,alpha-trehalose-phosphate synthase (UDP-forming)/trehalose-phosphatase n=1 Tax=Lutibacter sp. B1 TaxID=2725996 RepID=UPI0014572E26|nr:bifunctional alpha,alpha-trehalose-phosphate synthase (UDP-forming)/trehalose-phosphatase [Lutibacter sp. B1]NLP58309.1 bifunctional alpha,alpha-trehalose-phosphate synthase (UDP-forming)/trehalose-phosphatase [Lutibacter sp. B1]